MKPVLYGCHHRRCHLRRNIPITAAEVFTINEIKLVHATAKKSTVSPQHGESFFNKSFQTFLVGNDAIHCLHGNHASCHAS